MISPDRPPRRGAGIPKQRGPGWFAPASNETSEASESQRSGPVRAKRFHTVQEVAELLGVSTPTIYREIRAGRFPTIRIRGRYVIPAKALDDIEQAALAHGLVDPGELPQ